MTPAVRDFAIREIGCIVCRDRGLGYIPCEKHHLTVGGKHGQKRRGERFTIGLCPRCHRGRSAVGGQTERSSAYSDSPTYADNARRFRALYPDAWLLDEQNRLIADWQASTLGVPA